MPTKGKKTIREYRSLDFRLRAVRMTEESQNVVSVARELNVPVQTLHNWIKAYRNGDLGEKIKLLPDHIAYITSLCKKRARELKSQQGEKSTRAAQKEMQTLQDLLAQLMKKERGSSD